MIPAFFHKVSCKLLLIELLIGISRINLHVSNWEVNLKQNIRLSSKRLKHKQFRFYKFCCGMGTLEKGEEWIEELHVTKAHLSEQVRNTHEGLNCWHLTAVAVIWH